MTGCLPDIQCTVPDIKIPIMQVGVENVEVPFKLECKHGGHHQLLANVSLTTNLDENTKGISMSRLLLTLKPYLDLPLKGLLIKQILKDLVKNLETTMATMKFEFRMPINKHSIKSDNEFPIYYKCKFEGQYYLHYFHGSGDIDCYKFFQGVTVQYASYCPCSTELCRALEEVGHKGFPHNQRSFADVLVEIIEPNYVWLEDIIELIESQVKNMPYPIIKRIDEQAIAKRAAENPMFVEDAIRKISHALNTTNQIYDYYVKCRHEESIHTSEAIAINWKGIEKGFSEKTNM